MSAYYRIQYREPDNDHPFNHWLNFAAEDGYDSKEDALQVISSFGQRMTTIYDWSLEFRVLVIETKVLESIILVP